MARNDFTTAHAAAHVAQFIAAQPVAPVQLLTLDERIDQVRAALIIAKAQDNQPEIERLRGVWAEISEEIEAEAVTSADLDADSYLPFEPTVAELRAAAALPPLDICPICKEVRDDLGRCGCDYRVYIDLDCLIVSHEQRPNTKAHASAWEWLSEVSSVMMRGAAYRIPSAKWSNTTYTSTADTCTCPARKGCWHREAAATLDLAREHEAIDSAALADLFA